MVQIFPVRCLKDNYSYIIYEGISRQCSLMFDLLVGLLVDPVQPKIILDELKKISLDACHSIKAVLTTHHHDDHSGGNIELLNCLSYTVPIYGGDSRIPGLTNHLFKNCHFPFSSEEINSFSNSLTIGSFKILPLFTPGHTKGSVCFVISGTSSDKAMYVFTGDTLFLSGCGRFFDNCKPDEMYYSLRLLKSLSTLQHPDHIFIYPGHEYALNNVSFSLTIDSSNSILQNWLRKIQTTPNYCSVPGALSIELRANPFLRVDDPSFQEQLGENDPITLLSKLRSMKNEFTMK